MELDDILNGETPESAPVADELVEAPEVETESAEGPARDEHGRFIPKGEETPVIAPETAPPAVQEAEHSPPPGLIEVRRKWQTSEQEKQALAQQVQALTAQLQAQQQPAQEPYFPSVYEDEAGFAAAVQQQAALAAQQQFMPLVEQRVQQATLEIHRQMMAAANPDFAETEASLFEMMRDNPALAQEVARQPNPVQWGYNYAKQAAQVRQIGSLDIAAIEAAAIAKYQAAQQAQPAPVPQALPTSLADQQSARLTGGTAPTGPPSLNQILGLP